MADVRDADPAQLVGLLCQHAATLLTTSRSPRSVRIQAGAVSVEVECGPSADDELATPVTGSGIPAAVHSPDAADSRRPDGRHEVRAPLVGTFYRAHEPGAKPFVEVGDIVMTGQQIAILEAMKLMNAVESDRPGRVTEILVPDGSAVEYDQPLVVLDVAGSS